MLSLETAQKLNDAGLPWEPQYGDILTSMYEGFRNHPNVLAGYLVVDKEFINDYPTLKPDESKELHKWATWLPRLDQLLGEIEKRGYAWVLNASKIQIMKREGLEDVSIPENTFYADTPEEAAAQALLWILEQEAKA